MVNAVMGNRCKGVPRGEAICAEVRPSVDGGEGPSFLVGLPLELPLCYIHQSSDWGVWHRGHHLMSQGAMPKRM